MKKADAPEESITVALENIIALYGAMNNNREQSKYVKELRVLNSNK